MAYNSSGIAIASSNIRPAQAVLAAPVSEPARPLAMSAALPAGVPGSSSAVSTASSTAGCCSTGRPVLADPLTGQTVCSCQLTSPGLAMSGYPRLDSIYNSAAYTAQALMATSPFAANGAAETSPLYSPFGSVSPYELKDAAEMYRGLAQTPSGLLTYDPTAMFAYPFGAGYGGMDLSAARRNKNATRETTSTLKAWLYEHRKNPYPTKGEKIMLAIITKMTLTQVSTWFANARRRLKKDNKMTWTPKNGSGGDSDNEDDDNLGTAGTDRDTDGDLDVGSSYNNNNSDHNSDHNRLNESQDSIDIDTLSEKDPSEDNQHRENEGRCSRGPTSSPTCQTSDKPHRHPTSDSEDDHNHSPPHHPHHPAPHPTTTIHPHLHPHHHPHHRLPQPHHQPPMSISSSVLQRTPAPHPGLFTPYPGIPRMPTLPVPPQELRPHAPTALTTTHHTPRTESPTANSETKDSTTTNNNKPKIWSLADIVTSSSSSSQSRTASPGSGGGPLRPSPTGGAPSGLSPSALGSLRAWTEATGGHYGLAVAAAAAQGLSHPYSRPAGPAPPAPHPGPPHPGVGISMHGAFSMAAAAAGGMGSLIGQHQNGFYTRHVPIGESHRMGESPSPSSEHHNKTAFKPVIKSKPTEINV